MATLTKDEVGAPTAPPRSLHDKAKAVEAIMCEAGCSRKLARRTLAWIESFVEAARSQGYDTQYPTDGQLRSREYRVFDRIMKHGAIPRRASAHAAVEAALLVPSNNEFGIRHNMRDEPGSPNYCTVQVCLNVMR